MNIKTFYDTIADEFDKTRVRLWDCVKNYLDTFEQNSYIMEQKTMLDHSKPFEFYAVLQKYNTPNRNGRIYPENILKREAENYKKMIQKGTSLSELNHPESSLIDLDRVSHMITDVWLDGPVLMGKLKFFTSPAFHERGVV